MKKRGKRQKCTSEKLKNLEPTDEAIGMYKEIETKSVVRLKEFLENGDQQYNKVATQILSTVNRLRSTLKSQIAVRASVFRCIADNKKELRMYIKASFPHMTKKKK